MHRDGWMLQQEAEWGEHSGTARFAWEARVPQIWSRARPHSASPVHLRMQTVAIGERDGPWYVQQYDVVDTNGKVRLNLGEIDWADWDHNGDLLFAGIGTVHRIASDPGEFGKGGFRPRALINLSACAFEEIEPVTESQRWFGDRPRGFGLR